MVKKKRKMKPLFFILLLLILLVGGGYYGYSVCTGPVNKNNSEEIEVVIPSGSNSSQIGHILKENHLIYHEMV